MTDRPIIFSAPMVRALLDGRKSMTRRILKPQPKMLNGGFPLNNGRGSYSTDAGWTRYSYSVGDRLWCREAFSYGWPVEGNHQLPECNQEHAITYRADGNHPFGGGKWKSPIHMPRWASRLTLTVTEVRVQRLQEISEADVVAEGCQLDQYYHDTTADGSNPHMVKIDAGRWQSPRAWYHQLWNSLHGPGAWDANPWVVAISFKTHKCNIDKMPEGV